jgi:hypothetical protein
MYTLWADQQRWQLVPYVVNSLGGNPLCQQMQAIAAPVSLAGPLLKVTIPGAVSVSILGNNDRGQACGNFIDATQVHHAYVAVLLL